MQIGIWDDLKAERNILIKNGAKDLLNVKGRQSFKKAAFEHFFLKMRGNS